MIINVISFDQPAGGFLLSAMNAVDIIRISKADPRKYDNILLESVGGIQREPSKKRIKEIAEYSTTVDATFPTPILLALNSESYSFIDENRIDIIGDNIADIVDGQHRVLGLKQSARASEFIIPVVFILDATEEQKALIFATINGKQTKVPASIIYDLFGVTKSRSPQKSAHELARAMNNTEYSPWFRRLKMLGKKTKGSSESLSQGTFIHFLLPHISSDPISDMDIVKKGELLPPRPNCIFNHYWRTEKDSTILKILINVFSAAKMCWDLEWNDPDAYILTKTTGFSGIMRALPEIFSKGKEGGDLSVDYFLSIFQKVKYQMESDGEELTSKYFSSSASGEAKFRDKILASINL